MPDLEEKGEAEPDPDPGSDLDFIERNFDLVADVTKQKGDVIHTFGDHDGTYLKTTGEIYIAKVHDDLMTKDRSIKKLSEEKLKSLREKIEEKLEEDGINAEDTEDLGNPFLPSIDE